MSHRTAPRPSDHAELMNLEARYALSWDSCDAEGWARVFTRDGVFEIEAVGDRDPAVVRGTQQLRAFCQEFTASFQGTHLPALPLLEIDGDTAWGKLNFQFVAVGSVSAGHTMTRAAVGTYTVCYLRTHEGWRMEHRTERAAVSSRTEFFG